MATVDEVKGSGFSFIWTIQNLRYCVQKWGEALSSPIFRMNEHDKWCLKLYPKGCAERHSILVKLQNLSNKTKVSYELSIITPIGLFAHEKVLKKNFETSSEYGCHPPLQQKDLNKTRYDTLSNKDSLTVTCRIWEMDSKPVSSQQCHVRTTIAVERATYSWSIENFVDFNNNKKSKKVPCILSQKFSFTMELFSTERTFAEDQIQIEIKQMQSPSTILFCTCEICLLGIDGKIVHSVRGEHYFPASQYQIWMLPLISKNKLLSRKELYLPNGTLSVRCEFAVSSYVSHNDMESTENVIVDLSKLESSEEETGFEGSLKDNLQCFYAEGKFSDLTIRSPNKEFRVHKTILCARSEVFSAMFERDMKESNTGVVDIEDVDDDTVSKMLLYVYTDTLGEDLEFGTASSLYFAADKYRITALKRKCSDVLKDNFSVANICEVLVLADRHRDRELKSASQNFIFEHSREVMDSKEWTKLMQSNLQLASETMHTLFKRL